MSSSSGPSWELCKENAAPLERGRNVKSLSRALAPNSSVKAVSREEDPEVQQFEHLVRYMERFSEFYAKYKKQKKDVDISEILKESKLAKDKDPLVHWLRYIKFHEENYPADTRNQFLLMERCTRTLLHHPQYANDTRYIRVCVLYADRTSTPGDVFKLLHQNKIGATVSMFWLAWAWVAEKKKDFQFAEKIFRKAISKKAKPTKLLDERYKQFQRRMSRHWLNHNAQKSQDGLLADDGEENDEDIILASNQRGALTGLTQEGVGYNNRSIGANAMASYGGIHGTRNRANEENINRFNRGPEPSSSMATFSTRTVTVQPSSRNKNNENNGVPAKSGKGFSIFVENDEDEDINNYNLDESVILNPNQRRQIVRNDDQMKENTQKAERWNERGGLHNANHHQSQYEPSVANVPTVAQRWGQSGADTRMAGGTSSQLAFQVFVDEEYANDNDNNDNDRTKTKQRSGNERSLRERVGDGDMVEKLARDPLRYVLNPSKVASDRTKMVDQREDKSNKREQYLRKQKNSSLAEQKQVEKQKRENNAKLSCGFDKNLLAKDTFGQECCFEEARAKARYFKILSPKNNFNLLATELDNQSESFMDTEETMDLDEEMECEMSLIRIDEEVDEQNHPNTHMKAALNATALQGPKAGESPVKAPMPRRVLFALNTSVNNSCQVDPNVSVASSTVDENDAVGVVGDKEETINTKLAMRELSVMFSSPMESVEHDRSDNPENLSVCSAKPLFAAYGGNRSASRISSKQSYSKLKLATNIEIDDEDFEDAENDENICPKNPNARTNRTAGFSRCAMRDMNQIAMEQEEQIRSALGERNPQSQRQSSTSEAQGFQIFCDGDESDDGNIEVITDQSYANPTHKIAGGPSAMAPFTIYEESIDSQGSDVANENEENKTRAPTFEIFEDNDIMKKKNLKKTEKDGDTATFGIYEDNDIMKENEVIKTENDGDTATFEIYKDDDLTKENEAEKTDNGDTATFSIFDDIVNGLDPKLESANEKIGTKAKSSKHVVTEQSRDLGFSIFVDGDENGTILSEDIAAFGDLSLIAAKEPDVHLDSEKHIKKLREKKVSSYKPEIRKVEKTTVDYNKIYDKNVSDAIDEAIGEAAQQASRKRIVSTDTLEWDNIFEEEISVYDRRRYSLPIGLKKVPKKGTEMDMGEYSMVVQHELGRGMYGVVLLCECHSASAPDIPYPMALKVQSPCGCLASEYSMLKTLGERISSKTGIGAVTKRRRRNILPPETKVNEREGDPFPFPKALSFATFSDGAVLGMTAGSKAGTTLIDVVNAHQGSIPELIAIHYTTRMLLHLETLHWHGKILHCDIKPDNWVLTSSKIATGTESNNLIFGSDLMLVDFGRAIDVTKVSKSGIDPIETAILTGSVAAEDMDCVAMREGMPWGTDIDTFGLCASAHVLLFGFHIEIEKVQSTKKWVLRKKLRRYWQKDLWQRLFDTLLNFDEDGGNSGSHPNSVRAIRKSFEQYLAEGQRRKEVESLLKNQARIFPSKK